MNPILSHHYPLCYARVCRFPYVGKISVGEEDVNFVYQFVKKNDTEYKKNIKCIKYEDHYITGIPIKFPNYEDFQQAFSMRTYGFDISASPWQDEVDLGYEPQECKNNKINNYVDILFHEAVYPIRVSVYEIYNPGNIIRIWAQNSEDEWISLWNGSPQIVPPASRLFSPPLESCNFKTNKLRLEFKPSSWDYYTKLDAVMLIGTSELIFSKNPEETITNLLKRINYMYLQHKNEDVHNLTIDYKNAHLDIIHLQQNFHKYCIVHNSDTKTTSYKSNLSLRKKSWNIISCVQSYRQRHSRHLLLKNDLNSAKRMKLSSDESKDLSRNSLSMFPIEIILKILEKLDLMTLCRLNQVNKRFYYLTQDPKFYKRCKYLQQLDLTASDFSVSDFVKFLDNCGKRLSHLRLSRCLSINDFALFKISKICKNLKQLDLDGCGFIGNKGFSYLEKLQKLEHLNVNYTDIKTVTLCKILQKNQQIRRLYLEALDIHQDAVAIQLRNSCQNLEVINLNFSFLSHFRFTSVGLSAFVDYKNLRTVKLRDFKCYLFDDSLNRLFSSCQCLEEIILSHVINTTLESLTQCQNLKRLHLHDSMFVTSNKYSVIFEQCLKLQEFHLIFCNIDLDLIKQWREHFPHVFVYVESFKESRKFIIQE